MSGKGETAWRLVALAGLAAGVAALALQLAGGTGETSRAAAPSAPGTVAPGAASVPALAGRSATLSRLLSDRRAVARVELTFAAKGILDATCRAEAADGAVSACFGDEKGAGTWSVEASSLCIAAPVLGLASPHCYEVSGAPPALMLVGPGILAGNMQLR